MIELSSPIGGAESPATKLDKNPADFGIRIDRNGIWYYHDSPITRMPLVKLFASVLQREADGKYWLVTPAERGRIEVADVPFMAVVLEAAGTGRDQILTFTTNVDDTVEAGKNHPLRITANSGVNGPNPYIHIRKTLEARLTRPVFYQLVDLGLEETIDGQPIFGVWSNGQFFPLGSLTDES